MRYVLGNFTPAEMVTDGNFIIYTVEMGLLLIGIIENMLMIGAIISTSALHLNLRILICNCCIGFILMAVGRAMIAVPLCIAHLRDVDISSHAWCFVANAVHHSSADSVCLSFVFIMLERTAGTIWSKDYEKTKIHVFPCVFAFLQWLIPMSMILGNFLDSANRMQYFLEYPHLPCQIEYLTPTMFLVTIIIILIGGEAAQLFDIITAIYTISFPICAFKCHPNLFRRVRRIIGWNSYAVRPMNLNEIPGFELTTAPIRTQTEYHFQELSRVWNA
ncbi:hypothetical protein GCK72_005134 [Caenorhabditis remanei]|uniref:Uncharacterized protein n=1 Tax=Caenorhabditis remanei TaxID=31234 RepID=A0A6A5HGE9_CAERE|nr:hypothetical protein GCK72_005134 [Caenorhabditis remanei]KAF1765182.1 hypothetical protein GCK72_005134 [Caenorhabditis remanei]